MKKARTPTQYTTSLETNFVSNSWKEAGEVSGAEDVYQATTVVENRCF